MPLAVTLLLLVVWLVVAWRAFQRGDVMLAGLLALVGVVLAVYRYRAATRRAQAADPGNPQNPVK